MAATHRWHPGATAVAPRWTIPVSLLPDESIGSFLTRAALAHGCSATTLTTWVWPGWRAWTTDVDRGLAIDRIEPLAQQAGIDASDFRRASIAPVATRIEGRLPDPNTGWKWILARSNSAGKRTTQHCPQCLADDDVPHLRVQWRFAWHTVCPRHHSTLTDRCTRCAAAIRPHRLDQTAQHLAQCTQCGADMRTGETTRCIPDALGFQSAADRVLRLGRGTCFGLPAAGPDWFETASFCASLLRRAASQWTSALDRLLNELQVEPPSTSPALPGARIERLQTRDREQVIAGVWRIMDRSVDELKAAVEESGISRQGLCERGGKMPTRISGLFTDLPDRGRSRYVRQTTLRRGPRSRGEVLRMMKRLERTLQSETR